MAESQPAPLDDFDIFSSDEIFDCSGCAKKGELRDGKFFCYKCMLHFCETCMNIHELILEGSHTVDKTINGTLKAELRFVLLGKTGNGKSSTGNTIIGKQGFSSKKQTTAVTQKCQTGTTQIEDKTVLIVDTPGLFDTELSLEETKSEIVKCINLASPGIHAFLLVVKAGERFTDEEKKSVLELERVFGGEFFDYVVVVFTFVDQWDEEESGESFDDYIKSTKIQRELKHILERCNYRYILFRNKNSTTEQKNSTRIELVTMINEMMNRRSQKFYTNDMFAAVERIFKQFIVKRMAKQAEKEAKEAPEVEMLHKQVNELTKKLEEAENKKSEPTDSEVSKINAEMLKRLEENEYQTRVLMRRLIETEELHYRRMQESKMTRAFFPEERVETVKNTKPSKEKKRCLLM